jgi:DNA-binding response OmpR family regulator
MRPDEEPLRVRAGVGSDTLTAGPLRVDIGRYEVHIYDREVELTAREFELLVFLIRRRGLVSSTQEISDAVWQHATSTNTVTVHINRLRAKLGDSSQTGHLIRTVRGVGYRLAPPLCDFSA